MFFTSPFNNVREVDGESGGQSVGVHFMDNNFCSSQISQPYERIGGKTMKTIVKFLRNLWGQIRDYISVWEIEQELDTYLASAFNATLSRSESVRLYSMASSLFAHSNRWDKIQAKYVFLMVFLRTNAAQDALYDGIRVVRSTKMYKWILENIEFLWSMPTRECSPS